MPRRTVTASISLALFLPALLHADDALQAQDKNLDGKWVSTSVVIKGEKVEELIITLLIEGDKVTMTEGTGITLSVDGAAPRPVEDSNTASGAIKVDPKSWAIDFMWEDGPIKIKGKTMKSIYNAHRDVLLLCISDAGKDRPTEFSSKKGDDETLIRLKRVKK